MHMALSAIILPYLLPGYLSLDLVNTSFIQEHNPYSPVTNSYANWCYVIKINK